MEVISLNEARAQGLTQYFTGKACVNGHIALRNVKGGCTQCLRERRMKKYWEGGGREARMATGQKVQARANFTVYGPFITRKQALEQGLSHYYIGNPCKRGHISHQLIRGGCFECLRERVGYTGEKSRHGRCPIKLAEKKRNAAKRQQDKRNTPEGRKARCAYEKARYASLPAGHPAKIRTALHARVTEALRWSGIQKSAHTADLIGCTIEELRAHLESQFVEGMSWDNWARDGWHIDHIRPCASFDLTDEAQQRECFHYTNLQPLWATENLQKGAKWAA